MKKKKNELPPPSFRGKAGPIASHSTPSTPSSPRPPSRNFRELRIRNPCGGRKGCPPQRCAATRPCFSPRKTHTKKNWKTGVATLISINLKPLKAATVAFKKIVLSYVFQERCFFKRGVFSTPSKRNFGSKKKCSPFLQPALYTPQRKNGKQKQQNTGVFERISQ